MQTKLESWLKILIPLLLMGGFALAAGAYGDLNNRKADKAVVEEIHKDLREIRNWIRPRLFGMDP